MVLDPVQGLRGGVSLIVVWRWKWRRRGVFSTGGKICSFPARFLNPPKSGSKFFVAAAFRRYPQNSPIISLLKRGVFQSLGTIQRFCGRTRKLPCFFSVILNAQETLERIRRESVTFGSILPEVQHPYVRKLLLTIREPGVYLIAS